VNDDTDAVYEGLQNDESLYLECERAARRAAVANDESEFRAELAGALQRIVAENKEFIPDFSNCDPIEYDNVDYDDMAELFDYDDYR